MKKNCRPENETSKNGKNSCKNSYEVHNLVKCVAFSSWITINVQKASYLYLLYLGYGPNSSSPCFRTMHVCSQKISLQYINYTSFFVYELDKMIRAVYLWSHRLLTLSSHSYAYLYEYLHGSILKFMCCSFSQVEQCIHFITMCFWIWPFYFTSNSPKAMKKSSCGYFIYTDEMFRCFFFHRAASFVYL